MLLRAVLIATLAFAQSLGTAWAQERVVREMAEIYAGNIVFGADLLEVPVKGPVAAKLQ